MGNIKEIELPGIGKKFQVEARSGDKLVIVVHDDGRRELYHYDEEDAEEAISQISLDDEESRIVAAIIGGMQYRPKALETIEVSLQDLVIEWCKVEPHFKSIGKSINELEIRPRTGATILAIVEKHGQKINPNPDEKILAETTIVMAGERQQIKAFKELLLNG
jgi:TrkA domain protein